jgi:hypothetical protein
MSKTTLHLLQVTDLVPPTLTPPLKAVEAANEAGASPGTTAHYGQSVWGSTTSPKTLTLTTAPGDLIVVYAMSESDNSGGGIPISATLTGNGLTWTLAQSNGGVTGVTPNRGSGKMWWAIDPTGGTEWTLTATRPASGAHQWGIGAIVIAAADHNGVGASNSVTSDGTAGWNVPLTTTADNSSVLFAMVDWSANTNQGKVWNTVNGFEPEQFRGNMGELTYWAITTNYAVYAAFYPDVGVAGLDQYAITNGTFGGMTLMAIEIKKAVGGGGGPVEFEGWGVPI